MAPNFKFALRIEIRNLNYPGIHVHVAYNSHFGGFSGHGGLQMTSQVKADLKIELSDLSYLCCHASLRHREVGTFLLGAGLISVGGNEPCPGTF